VSSPHDPSPTSKVRRPITTDPVASNAASSSAFAACSVLPLNRTYVVLVG